VPRCPTAVAFGNGKHKTEPIILAIAVNMGNNA